jgi:hypothetical protein
MVMDLRGERAKGLHKIVVSSWGEEAVMIDRWLAR